MGGRRRTDKPRGRYPQTASVDLGGSDIAHLLQHGSSGCSHKTPPSPTAPRRSSKSATAPSPRCGASTRAPQSEPTASRAPVAHLLTNRDSRPGPDNRSFRPAVGFESKPGGRVVEPAPCPSCRGRTSVAASGARARAAPPPWPQPGSKRPPVVQIIPFSVVLKGPLIALQGPV